MTNKQLFILAPNDRFNYGDLLFPYIITHYIGEDFEKIRYVSTIESDLSKLGGHLTEKHSCLYNKSEQYDNYLIVAGGEALFADWAIIMSYASPKYYKTLEFLKSLFWFKKGIGIRLFFGVVNKLLSHKTKYPFSVGKNELPHFKRIFYNALGGGSRKIPYEKDILNSIDYISVRDYKTKEALDAVNISNTQVADCAILMSDVFDEDSLTSNLSIQYDCNKPYVFFQGNVDILTKETETIANQLRILQNDNNLDVCLCPIGTAFGHEDNKGLKHLAKYLDKYSVRYTEISNPSIYDIMWLIKNSKLYIGSSLHGVITSMSFNVNYVGYSVEKVNRYLATWGDSSCYCNNPSEITACSKYSLSKKANVDLLVKQKESVLRSFDLMKDMIV